MANETRRELAMVIIDMRLLRRVNIEDGAVTKSPSSTTDHARLCVALFAIEAIAAIVIINLCSALVTMLPTLFSVLVEAALYFGI